MALDLGGYKEGVHVGVVWSSMYGSNSVEKKGHMEFR